MFEKLYAEGLISPTSKENLRTITERRLFTLNWELKTILYLGVLLLTGGLGILVYKHIDTIGHQAILAAIALACIGSFYYCFRKKLPFSWQKVPSPNVFFDYILLLGCLLFVIFITYLQAVYGVFHTNYGTATFIPLIVLFFSAYYFDHLGVLSLAITNLAAWLGVNAAPLYLFRTLSLIDMHLIMTGLFLGAALIGADFLSHYLKKKPHFGFTYRNVGTHIFLVACLAGLFNDIESFDSLAYLRWFALQVIASIWFFREGFRHHSFYFVLIVALYGYVSVTYVVTRFLAHAASLGDAYLGILYCIGSATGFIVFLVKANKKIKHDSI